MMNSAKSSFVRDLAAETGRLAIWCGSAFAIALAIPLLLIALAQVDWARLSGPVTLLAIVAVIGAVVAGAFVLRDRLFRHGGSARKAHEQ